ncbi:hypothetical protein BP6252_13476 [Coleophoma cylindrospora]|uniref:Complex I intermediate-associated protein 84 n=1 Tax=Coleophoma cylindrospora TaxID=1849047 RepID=A0A3D8Q8A2_9HELO|nr:hypothetical protein BP6252_13476 [Coleophoma cylindrospora]
MASHLTRQVFRALLSNEGLVLRCPNRTGTLCRRQHALSLRSRMPSQRTLFGFSEKAAKLPKEPSLVPGYRQMLELNSREKLQARPPPRDELVKAFAAFFNHKRISEESINNLQAQHALRTFRYIQKNAASDGGDGLTNESLRNAMLCLARKPNDQTNWHCEFAKELYAELARRNNPDPNFITSIRYIKVLTFSGNSLAARDQILALSKTNSNNIEPRKGTKAHWWPLVLEGFAAENNESELVKSLELAKEDGIDYTPRFQYVVTKFYFSKNDTAEAKFWFDKALAERKEGEEPHQPLPETLVEMLRFSIRNNELDWCNTKFRQLLDSEPTKALWDVIFQWAAGALGKGVEDVERMMEVMIRRYPEEDGMRPDADTINGLVQLAIHLEDPYLAERYLSMGQKRGIRPNSETFILQLDYRIEAGDLTGAQAAYEALQIEEVANDEDLPIINKYIRALCTSKSPNSDAIQMITSDLEQRHARLEADTVAALSTLYLNNREFQEVVDLLQTNAFHQNLEERALVRKAFVDFCFDRNTSTALAWETYTIILNLFKEADIKERTGLMNEFFDRGRSDMACHVFGHMRAHIRKEIRPVAETYIQCFEGIAKHSDRESLDMVHNMMKLDVSIEPSTRLYNSLMLAYTACDDGYRALDYWSDITNSREGPNYKSLEIVFRACSRRPFGDQTAREIWTKMRRMEIEITPKVFAAYCGALAGQGKVDEVKSLIEDMEKDFGFGPDFMTLGIFYNSTKGQNRKDIIENWAKELYPEAWAELAKFEQIEEEEGWMTFKIVLDMTA